MGGNIFNLLRFLKADMRRYDFSHLAVWQAYMIGDGLQDTNFECADLAPFCVC